MLPLFKRTLLFSICLSLIFILAGQVERACAKEKSSKVIDFDDEVVEGLNKKPYDSLSQISERNKKRHKPHLYRKRAGFKSETAESMRAVQYTP